MVEDMDKFSKALGLENRSALIKMAVESLLRYLRTHPPESLQLDFAKLLSDLDGRTHRYSPKSDKK
jgi:hypothetical protein